MTREAWNTYRTELQRVGKDPSSARVTFSGSSWLTVSDDPERTFALHAPGLLCFYNSPSGAHLPRPQTPEDLKRLNLVNIVTPEYAVMLIKEAVGSIPAETYGVRIAPPGVPLQYVAENIELFAKKVIPQFME